MPDLLELAGVSASYGRIQALSGVSLSVPEGSIVALLGSNGAGKTTTLNTISRLVPVQSGSIRFDGKAVESMASHKVVEGGVVQVPEGREVFRDMSVRENLEMGAYRRKDAATVRADFDRVLDYFPKLRDRLQQRAGTLSGGEQQMLLIGRALMARPRLLLLDEPSLGLSPVLVQQIFGIIDRLNKDGLTILLVEQNAAVALSTSSYAYILENGEMALQGASDQLRRDDSVRRTYLGH
ncbi:ABC transporter ATP-binding protein [Microvirga sp. BT688]|jgi:branched-chain amino acid transport system ATP-binding protein|uniref:ABC transporter ATP-binding protein n=1 Tax=Microvirga sp. TaxID=1873136 RepID=UPI001687070C|nr:ABC transporter ATP-binding protein [Microvirga sp.]MBD2751072.1 ABC transporter ATP-binding protein [Microvirga sp.]